MKRKEIQIQKPRLTVNRLLTLVLSNGPVIVTVLGSALVAILASVVSFTTVQFLQAILALLCLIGTSLLTDRLIAGRRLQRHLKSIDSQMSEVLNYTRNSKTGSLNNFIIERRELSPLETRFDGADSICILGGSLFRLANEYQNLFEKLVNKGCKLRFLLTDPESDASIQLSSTVSYESSDHAAYKSQMKNALISLSRLTEEYPDSCALKLYRYTPPFSIVLIEKSPAESTIQVEIYAFKVPARNRLTIMLRQAQEPELYRFFSSQFESIWDSEFSQPFSSSS